MTTAGMYVQIVIIIILSSLFCTSYGKYPKLQLTEELFNFDIENTTNNIFIGGENVLLKASPSLAELKRVATGPKLDYINCLDKPACNGTPNTNNRNKVLLIDSTNKQLITCGSLKHGVCQGRNLDSLVEISEISRDEYVVSNSDLPAVALITSIWDYKTALYIATSWDEKYGKDPFDILIATKPAVSTRNTYGSDAFAFSSNDLFIGISWLQFKKFDYLVKYIHGFSLGGFTYFVSVQETTESFKQKQKQKPKVFKTFIIRLCQQDKGYFSYVELPLECQGSNGTNFNIATSAYITKPGDYFSKSFGLQASDDVLVVAFVKTNGRWDDPAENSAICMYPVKEINTALAADQQKCMDGTYAGQTLGLSWTSDGVDYCADKASVQSIQPDFCPTTSREYLRYRAKVSLPKSAIVEHDNKVLTSVAAMPYHNHTVIFIGTAQGRLLKVSVEDGRQKVEPYSEMKISSNEVRQMKLTSDYKHLVILSKHMVTKVPVEECSSFSSCTDCVKPKDPFCGWCTLYNRCTQKQDCSQADVHPLRFVKSVSNCVEIASINPDKVPYGPSVDLQINVTNLPPLQGDGRYKCFIYGKERATSMLPDGRLNCSTPPSNQLPSITNDTGDIFVDLALFSTESQTFFVSKKLGFYSCTAVKGCRNCAEGSYKCYWCTYQGICTDDGSTRCPGEFILPTQDRLAGLKGCPSLQSDKTLLVPVDINTNITVPAHDLPSPKADATYKCIVTVDGITQTTQATRISDTQLVCSPTKYSYLASLKRQAVTLTVTFRKSNVYVPSTFKVYLYKCWVSRTDCSTCHYEVAAEPKLKCGWCKAGTPKCVVREGCIGGTWVPHTSKCLTTPNITKVWPVAGPVAGGTEVEIHGYDMGKSFADIANTVMVAGYRCEPDDTKYQPSKLIFCNTSVSNGPVIGPVTVTVSNIEGKSTQKFHYQNPEPQDFNPKKGPRSGGTTVTITGRKMNTGRYITVEVAGRPCLVDRSLVTDSSVPCITGRALSRKKRASNGSTQVIISFDGFSPTPPEGNFIYTPDPTVTAIEPNKVFFGGGLELRVSGTYLDTIQKPKIFFKYPSENGTLATAVRECTPVSSSLMICHAPKVPDLAGNVSEVTVAFIMDAVNVQSNYTTVTMFPDPYFKPFADGVYTLKEDNLILEATNLENALRGQISVTVGGLPCNITSLDKEQLVCLAPPEESHKSKSTDGYAVKVDVGDLHFSIGMLKYFKAETKAIPLIVWIAVGGGAFVAIIIITVILCWCRRSRRKQKRNFKSLEVQMNNLESKVARECREAFAELQTDVTDLTSDLSTSGMPFLDFQSYALHVLFPGLDDHPVLHKNKLTLTENWEKGLRQFSQLIYNKKFLLVFIRTLEAQNTFQMKDRCNVASLLMVALQAKMEYATDILKDLLCELIRKSVAKSHPKLLLRRTESVAEKMLTNWLAFCMYNFLKNDVGEPLFMLFKAVKQQTEKGPVDAVTGEARYSLSEDKLLRQAVDFKILNVTVTYESNPPAAVVLLDCDTVSQAKEKMLDVIFKNSPYSSRPARDDLQLEWEQSSGRVLALRDDDSQSLIEGEWRKMNTLSHYQVTDNASLRLVTGQRYFYSSTDSELNKRNVLRVGFSPGASYSPLAVVTTDGPDEGGRLWHLVKQMDYPTDRAEDDRNSKFLSEIYLTRLLKTKGTLQQFVERLFRTVFMRYRRGSSMPPAVKFLFDLLDTQAKELNLSDAEVLHTWKNNSLPLRFWINIIKNPNFIFDVSKSAIVDSCLSVVAQLFMDSCSVSEHVLGKDSPSNKLLYAREIPGYRQEVEKFYADLQAAPAPSPQELSNFFTDLSIAHGHEFNSDQALSELHDYVRKYQDQLQEALEESELSSLASKLEHVIATISDD